MKYYIIAGEASGDLHASNLMKAIQEKDGEAVFRCWGGDLMQQAGGEVVKHYRDLAFMGFAEVVRNLRTIAGNLSFCRKDISSWKPDVLILVDYPGFNLRIAKFASQAGFRVVYYISPQVWAWKKSRVHKIKKYVGLMIVILPFEQDFYAKYDYPVAYAGHPLLDVILPPGEAHQPKPQESEPLVALLPGSRKQEIERILPIMLSVVPSYPGISFVIAGAPGISPDFYTRFTGQSGVSLQSGRTYELLRNARAALVTSGTASLETALFMVPQVICYKGSRLSFAIARRIVKVPFIGLPNLIMQQKIVEELIQDDLTPARLKEALDPLLREGAVRDGIIGQYSQLRTLLGGPGASQRAAAKILEFFKGSA